MEELTDYLNLVAEDYNSWKTSRTEEKFVAPWQNFQVTVGKLQVEPPGQILTSQNMKRAVMKNISVILT